MSFRSSTSSFRRSLLLGAVLVLGGGWAAERSEIEPVAFFGGWKLARKVRALEELERSRPVDVLAIGPSYVDTGFDARLFSERTGKAAFNLGIAGTDLYFQALLLRDFLLRTCAPEAIVWGIGDVPLTRRGISEQYVDSPAMRQLRQPLGRWLFDLERRLPHYRKRRLAEWCGWERSVPELPIDDFGLTRTAKVLGAASLEPAPETEEEASDEEDVGGAHRSNAIPAADIGQALACFEEAIRLARARGIAVYLVLTPYHESVFAHSNYRRDMLRGRYDAFRRRLTGIVRQHGVILVNLRSCAAVSPEAGFFFEPKHLNERGAAATTGILAQIFQGEPVQASWSTLPSPAELRALQEHAPPGAAPDTGK